MTINYLGSISANDLPATFTKFFVEPVSVGFPSPANDYLESPIDLNQYLIKNGAATFLVRVSGDSMLDANIADQTTRAIVAALQKSDFQDNIDEVFKSVNPFTDSLERLNTALSDAKLLKTINDEFPKLGGALATLANQSIETVKSFVLLSGGIQNLQNLQKSHN